MAKGGAFSMAGMEGKLSKLRKEMPGATAIALQRMMRPALAEIINHCPRDTNRMVRGFEQAANQARLGPFAESTIILSARASEYGHRLEEQVNKAAKRVNYWMRWRDHYIRDGRTRQPWFRVILGQLDPAKRSSAAWIFERAMEEVKKYAATEGTGVVVENRGRKITLTVRDKVYGGAGAMVLGPQSVYVVITNREPHAIIMERRKRTVRSVLAGAKKHSSLRSAKGEMLRRLKAAAGMAA